jgi:chromosome segregation ATPase
MSLDQILTRFHALLLSPTTPLGPEDLYSVSYLFSFYQRHISELQNKVLELEATGNELARRYKVQGVDRSGLSEAALAKDSKQEIALARLKSIADSAEQMAQQSKHNEKLAVERLAKITMELEEKDKSLFSLRSETDKMLFKLKEAEMEIQRLNHTNKMLNGRYEDVLKEKREALELAEDAHHRFKQNEGKSDEIEALKHANERLKSSAEGLIDEVCR